MCVFYACVFYPRRHYSNSCVSVICWSSWPIAAFKDGKKAFEWLVARLNPEASVESLNELLIPRPETPNQKGGENMDKGGQFPSLVSSVLLNGFALKAFTVPGWALSCVCA